MSLFGKSKEEKANDLLRDSQNSLSAENELADLLYQLESKLDDEGLTILFSLLQLITDCSIQNGSFSIQGKILNIQNGKIKVVC